jgi:hypothetical protein
MENWVRYFTKENPLHFSSVIKTEIVNNKRPIELDLFAGKFTQQVRTREGKRDQVFQGQYDRQDLETTLPCYCNANGLSMKLNVLKALVVHQCFFWVHTRSHCALNDVWYNFEMTQYFHGVLSFVLYQFTSKNGASPSSPCKVQE